jgi:hypothetical protein
MLGGVGFGPINPAGRDEVTAGSEVLTNEVALAFHRIRAM